MSFSPHHAPASPAMEISGLQMHYNFHPGNGRDQPAILTTNHERPSHRDFQAVIVRGFAGTGFLASSQELSHVVKLTDMPRLETIQVHDCSHCQIVVELGQVILY